MKKFFFFKRILTVLFICIIATMQGCSSPNESESAQIFALNTVVDISAYGKDCKTAVQKAKAEIYRLEKILSVTDENSEIYKLNHSDNTHIKLSAETYELIRRAVEMSALTEGRFDITIYPVLKLWGFTTGDYHVPDEREIDHALDNVGRDKIILENNNQISLSDKAQIDLGGIAKGFIADKAAEAMAECDIAYGIISLGGNVRTVGKKPSGDNFSVGIQHPDKKDYFATVSVDDVSVITSGAYQRNFTEEGKTYHHIINPENGCPAQCDISSVTVIGKDGTLCDALSTAIFIGGTEYAHKLRSNNHDFEYILLTDDNAIIASENLRGKLIISDSYPDLKTEYR